MTTSASYDQMPDVPGVQTFTEDEYLSTYGVPFTGSSSLTDILNSTTEELTGVPGVSATRLVPEVTNDSLYLSDYLSALKKTVPYEGETSVPITSEQQTLIDLVNRLVTGEEGRFKSLLSGEVNTGLLDRAVIAPARREMREHTLPGLADIYSGGVFGDSGYYSGDRRRAQGEALTDQGDLFAQLRYQADVEAQNKALQAGGQLPGMMGIEDLERQNDVLNLQRAIDVHYRNQGLNVQQGQQDLQYAQMAMAVDQYNNAQTPDDNAGLGSILGSLGGAGLGWLAGGALAPATGGMSLMAPLMGATAGAGIGGGIGQYLGGSPNTGAANVSSGINNLMSQMMMSQMMQGGGGMGNSVLNQQPLGGTGAYDPYYMGSSYGMYPNYYGGF